MANFSPWTVLNLTDGFVRQILTVVDRFALLELIRALGPRVLRWQRSATLLQTKHGRVTLSVAMESGSES